VGSRLRTIAVIQARMASTRFPGKVLAELCGMPMLSVLLHRIYKAKGIDEVVVATTTSSKDDILVDWLIKNKVTFFRGSENDVLDRYWQCAKKHRADIIVRITADDPLKDPEIIACALAEFSSNKDLDYVSNTIRPTFPEGLDIEIFSFHALDLAHKEANLISEREHVTPYIWKNPARFSLKSFVMHPDLSKWRWTVDKPEDLLFVRTVFSHFANNIQTNYRDIIKLINENPQLAEINTGTIRNEGYLKTLSMETNL
jgi:spore coat polysaccharide biosynthesis protein SpsF